MIGTIATAWRCDASVIVLQQLSAVSRLRPRLSSSDIHTTTKRLDYDSATYPIKLAPRQCKAADPRLVSRAEVELACHHCPDTAKL